MKKPQPSRRSDELFRLAVEAAPNAMLMADPAGKIVLVNSQTEKVFGYSRAELLGQGLSLLIPARFRAAHPGHVAGFFARPATRAMGAGRDLHGARKDGTEIPIEIGLNPLETPEGRFVLASIIDLTERKVLEKKLAHTQAMAAVGGMAAAVAHEIRNPLGSITMAAKVLSRGGLGQEDLEQVMRVLVDESQRLNRTLDDFLQFARPRVPKLQTGDLNATIKEVLSAIKADKSIVGDAAVMELLDKSLPALAYDLDQIRQVLWNIIRNGFQALGGSGLLEVSTERRPQEAVIHIKDSGPGIPKDQLENLFSPFYTTKPKGTGLGLSISRNIILAHGGDISIDSTPGEGCRFSIRLPLTGSR